MLFAGAGGWVATREGGVDRHKKVRILLSMLLGVATREGGVDRNNAIIYIDNIMKAVATREGGVDRNLQKFENSCRC